MIKLGEEVKYVKSCCSSSLYCEICNVIIETRKQKAQYRRNRVQKILQIKRFNIFLRIRILPVQFRVCLGNQIFWLQTKSDLHYKY